MTNTRVVLFMPKKGNDWGYQKPWMIRGASNKIWSKNTVELRGISDWTAFFSFCHSYQTYSGCLRFG